MIGAGVHLYIYIQKFARGGANSGYLKKGAHLQAASVGALEDNVKN